MKKRFSIAVAALAALSGVPSSVALAAAPSSLLAWVSKQGGTDNGTCGAAATPCRTIQYAHDNIVAAGGTIMIRDAGGYREAGAGPLVIQKSISIINEGGFIASIVTPSGGDGIAVAAGPNDVVMIKGLTIDGVGQGNQGITLQTAAKVTIANCTIQGFKTNGIWVAPTTGAIDFVVNDALITKNEVNIGISPSGSAKVTGSIGQSILSFAPTAGLLIHTFSSVDPNIAIDKTSIISNADGINSNASNLQITDAAIIHNSNSGIVGYPKIVMSKSKIALNGLDILLQGGGFQTTGDNLIGTTSGVQPTPLSYK